MSGIKCFYHHDRDSVTKCEFCHKMICLECRTIDTVQHSSTHYHGGYGAHGVASHTTYYATQHELCPECFYDKRINAGPGGFLVMILFGIIWTAIISVMISSIMSSFFFMEQNLLIIPILFVFVGIGLIIGGIYGIIVKLPRTREDARIKKQQFLDSIRNYVPGQTIQQLISTQIPMTMNSPNFIVCFQCGSQNSLSNEFCGKCGAKIR